MNQYAAQTERLSPGRLEAENLLVLLLDSCKLWARISAFVKGKGEQGLYSLSASEESAPSSKVWIELSSRRRWRHSNNPCYRVV